MLHFTVIDRLNRGSGLCLDLQGFPDNHPRTIPRVRWGRNNHRADRFPREACLPGRDERLPEKRKKKGKMQTKCDDAVPQVGNAIRGEGLEVGKSQEYLGRGCSLLDFSLLLTQIRPTLLPNAAGAIFPFTALKRGPINLFFSIWLPEGSQVT